MKVFYYECWEDFKVRSVLELENFDILELWQYTGEHDTILKSEKYFFLTLLKEALYTTCISNGSSPNFPDRQQTMNNTHIGLYVQWIKLSLKTLTQDLNYHLSEKVD